MKCPEQELKKVCVVVNGYPTRDDPIYAFIQPVVHQMAEQGLECCVIAPQSITKAGFSNRKLRPYKWIDYSPSGKEIVIYQPRYLSVSSVKICGVNISAANRDNAVLKCYKKERIEADVLYGHFWDCSIAACKIADYCNRQVFVATGESRIRIKDYYASATIDKCISRVSGVICVSSKNYHESIRLGLIKQDITPAIIAPNGFNPNEFYNYCRTDARKKIGIPSDLKVVAFVGAFSERKGVQRVINAVNMLDDVKLMLIGNGEKILPNENIVFWGTVAHDDIVNYLNAADVFVLPTLAEGCCNAIVEAIACGLPVVSSDKDFNYDVLDEDNSILIDPMNEKQIAKAIKEIFDNNDVRVSLEMGAKNRAKDLTIEKRVEKIISFMKASYRNEN